MTSRLAKAIDLASKLLEWRENWDDEGAKPFKPATFERVKKFLVGLDDYALNGYDYASQPPKILPGQEGAMELLWLMPSFSILVTVPEDPGAPIAYFGHDSADTQVIQGKYSESIHASALYSWICQEMRNVDVRSGANP